MGIEEKEIIELVSQIEELEKKLFSHPMHKVCTIDQFMFLNAMICSADSTCCGSSLSRSNLMFHSLKMHIRSSVSNAKLK